MSEEIRQLATEAVRLVNTIPEDVVQIIFDKLTREESKSASELVSSALAAISNPDFRRRSAKFLKGWTDGGGILPPSTIGAVLLAASESKSEFLKNHSTEVTWTGPGGDDGAFRHSEQALLELINSAQRHLLVVSYAVFSIENIRKALARAAVRGVKVSVIVDGQPGASARSEYDTFSAIGKDVATSCSLYYWPEEKRPKGKSGKPAKLHVKVAVADGQRFLLTSANLTSYAFEMNMELGVLATDEKSAGSIVAHFAKLISLGELRPLP